MSGSARSKVDLHLASAFELTKLAAIHGEHAALSSSACLQFELSLGFYLIELLQTGRQSISPWPISADSLGSLARQFDALDLQELSDLAQEDTSWLYRMLKRLAVLRRCDTGRALRGEIFQSDLEEPVQPGRLIVSSLDERDPAMEVTLIATDLKAYESLLSRQRLGREEY